MNHDTSRSAIENGPDIDEDDTEPGEVCDECDGWGWFTDDADRDYECRACESTGRVR